MNISISLIGCQPKITNCFFTIYWNHAANTAKRTHTILGQIIYLITQLLTDNNELILSDFLESHHQYNTIHQEHIEPEHFFDQLLTDNTELLLSDLLEPHQQYNKNYQNTLSQNISLICC